MQTVWSHIISVRRAGIGTKEEDNKAMVDKRREGGRENKSSWLLLLPMNQQEAIKAMTRIIVLHDGTWCDVTGCKLVDLTEEQSTKLNNGAELSELEISEAQTIWFESMNTRQ